MNCSAPLLSPLIAFPPVQTTAEMIVDFGNEVCRGASAPTPFWRRTIEVFSEIIGRSWSEREGVASRRALFAQRTGDQLWTSKASE